MRPLANLTIAVVGATGAVGKEILQLLAADGIPPDRIQPYASARSAGSTVDYGHHTLSIRDTATLTDARTPRPDIALLAASAEVALHTAPALAEAGTIVIDNSSAFRMHAGTPLVIPEVNAHDAARHNNVIANPNCSTIIMLVAATPIRNRFGVSCITASTYQAASGAGIAAMNELREQTQDVLQGEHPEPRVFKEPCAFNVFSHDSEVDPDTGLNVEEQKMIDETRKIWSDPGVTVRPTCVRVPVLRAHAESLSITTKQPASVEQVHEAFEDAAGIKVLDDRAGNAFPTSLRASNRHEVIVGRIRAHANPDGTATIELFVAGDQLLKGAALNAVQIAHLVSQ